MTLQEYINSLNKVIENHPEAAEYVVVYSIDDEGNNFQEVHFTHILGYFDEEDFISHEDDFEEREIEQTFNAICIN